MTRDVRSTTAGALFITATAASLIGTALRGSLLQGPDLLARVSLHQDRVLMGAFFQLLAAFTSAAIAISLYPVLRRHAAGMALGAVGFRLIEGVFYALSALGTLTLVALSDQPTVAGAAAGATATHTSVVLLQDLRDAASLIGVLAFYTGATAYYLVFYRSRLIPRWLSVWGLAGTALGLVAALLVLFRAIGMLSAPQALLNVPIALQEMVLAVWLIWKGFALSVPSSDRDGQHPPPTRQPARAGQPIEPPPLSP